jgi:hypothetical protein
MSRQFDIGLSDIRGEGDEVERGFGTNSRLHAAGFAPMPEIKFVCK